MENTKTDLVESIRRVHTDLVSHSTSSNIQEKYDKLHASGKYKLAKMFNSRFSELAHPDTVKENDNIKIPTYSYSECYDALAYVHQMLTYAGEQETYDRLRISPSNSILVDMDFGYAQLDEDLVILTLRRAVAYHMFTGEPIRIHSAIRNDYLQNNLDMVIIDMCKTVGYIDPVMFNNIMIASINPWDYSYPVQNRFNKYSL